MGDITSSEYEERALAAMDRYKAARSESRGGWSVTPVDLSEAQVWATLAVAAVIGEGQ